jgi:hypothetical protein
MTKRIPLDALIRRVSRMAEQRFNEHGDIDPMWLVENARGEQHMIVSPIIADSPLAAADTKDQIVAKMREYFAEHDIVRYACAKEVWTLVDPEHKQMPTREQAALVYAAMGYTLAHHPDRREVVCIDAEDGTEVLTAERDIIRPAHGKPYLDKLGPIERYDEATSRWAGLLPSKGHDAALRERPVQESKRVRFISELAEDVIGHAFVTAVPNAPIQLGGFREKATGELYVDGVFVPKEGYQPDATPGIEIMTGPEAERLILSVHLWLTERAEAEGLTFDEYMAKRKEREP